MIPSFKLASPLGTDIWRKPPTIDVFSAPTYPSPLPQYPLKSFQRVRFTVALPSVTNLRQFDQAGLVLHFTKPDAELGSRNDKWIKTGIEFYNGKPYISTAGTDQWSDWSVVPLLLTGSESKPTTTIEARREKGQLGKSLWVYQIIKDEQGNDLEREPLREINWVFAEDETWSVGIGGYVARETEGEGEDLLETEFADGIEVGVLDPEK